MKLEKIYIFMEPYDYNYRGQGFYIYPFSFSSWDDFQDGLKESYENYPPEVEEWEFVDSDGINDYCMDQYGMSEDNWDNLQELGEFGEDIGLDLYDILKVASDMGGASKDYLEEAYAGEFDSLLEYAYDYIDSVYGNDIPKELAENYFDWDGLGLALVANGDLWALTMEDWEDRYETEAEAQRYHDEIRDMSYEKIAEWYVYDMVGDLESALGNDVKDYFNYKSFARDLGYDYSLIKDRVWRNH